MRWFFTDWFWGHQGNPSAPEHQCGASGLLGSAAGWEGLTRSPWCHIAVLLLVVFPVLVRVCRGPGLLSSSCLYRAILPSTAGSDGAASSYQVKQLEEQNARLKEALVR